MNRDRLSNLLRGRILVAVALGIPVTGGGCHSVMFVEGPPVDYERRRTFECTSDYFWPITDTILAVSAVTLGGVLASQENARSLRGLLGVNLALSTGIIAAVSAGFGYRRVGRCRDAYQWIADNPPPARLRPPDLSPAPGPRPEP